MKKRKGEEITFETMYTSVWLYIGHVPDELTLYQFHALFSRVAQFKNYDTSTLFATVSKDAKIDPWYKLVNILEENEKKISLNEFSKNQQNKLSL
jgi:ABC-type uncharacterized transport system ATPase subunit